MTPFLERQFHLSIGRETFQVAVVISSSNAHFVGVISSYKGSGADSPYLSVGEGDDALACAASKVGSGAFVVPVVSGPAIPAAPIIGAVAGLMPRVLAVAPEAVDMRRERLLTLPKGATRRSPWIFYHSPLKAVFSFAVFWVGVRGPLCYMDAWDDAAGRGSGASAQEMGNQSCPDRCMCQVALHLILFLFSFELLPS